MSEPVLGWDVGGANLKVARLNGGVPARPVVREQPFPMWRLHRRLPAALCALAGELGSATRIGVTMTGELADCFASKGEGVDWILEAFARAFPRAAVRVFGCDGRFHAPEAARLDPHLVAAANWAAPARVIARTRSDAILVDVGSTTTDVIPVLGGQVAARGFNDPARLATGELVYTGVLRTPVCALVRDVPLAAGRTRVAAEHFAIAADAYRWLRRIPASGYTCETPDGRGVSRREAAARLARMVCADPGMLAPGDVSRIARAVERAQVRQIARAVSQVLRHLGSEAPEVAVVLGSGAGLGRRAARRAGLAVAPPPEPLATAAGAAPAAAVALLLAEEPA